MIYFISDTHFGHEKIIQYCNRPYKNVEEMDKDIIEKWNNTVKLDDIVYHLGDVSWYNKGKTSNIIHNLNGTKYLIKGNHDRDKSNQWWRDVGFKEVYDMPIILNEFIVLSHEPMPFVPSQTMVNFYGHVHDSELFRTLTEHSACICIERWNYNPVGYEALENSLLCYKELMK